MKDIINQNNLRYYPVHGLAKIVQAKIVKGGLGIYSYGCESNNKDPITLMEVVEEKMLLAVDSLGEGGRLFSLINSRGNLYADGKYREVKAQNSMMVSDGSGLKGIPQKNDGKYAVTTERSSSSLGVRILKKELISATIAHWMKNPPVEEKGDTSQMFREEPPSSPLPEDTQATVTGFTCPNDEVNNVFDNKTILNEAILIAKNCLKTNKITRDKASRGLITALCSPDEIQGFYFDGRQS